MLCLRRDDFKLVVPISPSNGQVGSDGFQSGGAVAAGVQVGPAQTVAGRVSAIGIEDREISIRGVVNGGMGRKIFRNEMIVQLTFVLTKVVSVTEVEVKPSAAISARESFWRPMLRLHQGKIRGRQGMTIDEMNHSQHTIEVVGAQRIRPQRV